MHALFGLALIPFGVIHFLPTIIAAFRGAQSIVGIFLLNFFLGWTVIGWVIALIWAITNEPKWMYYGYPQGPRRY